MSRDASITLAWGDGDHMFRLAWGELEKLQEECDAGPFVVLERLQSGQWKVQDIANVIRWGLIGGGKTSGDALSLVKRYVTSRPPMESLFTAQVILSAACVGAPEEDRSKKEQAPDQESGSTASPTGSSGSEPSTE